WMQMAGWYTDFTSQDAELRAFEEAGITRVRRHEQNDEKVCALCRSLDGKIYKIDEIPVLEHLRCRRWFEVLE
ncbi:MAG: phage head morphogenesis protein, partial [Oscillospiraceae bacterium]|nr:phage head morphogenesis protein [Oscillospiraceae bacterium]